MEKNSSLHLLYKKLGETPLETILRFKEKNPEFEKVPMTYAGRLDPMAEGLLLVLSGNTRDKDKYLSLDKAYEFEVLWGLSSDTYDILGKVVKGKTPLKIESKMDNLLKKILAKKTQSYPIFSSKFFRGNFLNAREKDIKEADIPERGIKIFSIEHIHTRLVKTEEVLKEVEERVALLTGDFRQEEVLKSWKDALLIGEKEDSYAPPFLISKFKIDVSSGTYVRGLASEMGKILECGALAYSIKRTRVGENKLQSDDSSA